MYRNAVTGQFCKPSFTLYLQDFGNLGTQIIESSESKSDLERIAENLNNAFIMAGLDKQFRAEIYQDETGVNQ